MYLRNDRSSKLLEILPGNPLGLLIIGGDVRQLWPMEGTLQGADEQIVDRCDSLTRPSVAYERGETRLPVMKRQESLAWLVIEGNPGQIVPQSLG